MIKIDNTIIDKVQKSENGVITEIPVVKTNDGTLLHLGLNTYKTEFLNDGLQDVPVDSYSPFSRKIPEQNTYLTIGSNFIRARLYGDTNITSDTTGQLFIRLDFPVGSYHYAAGKICDGIEIQLDYNLYSYNNLMKAWANASISWKVGASNVSINTIKSSLAGDVSNMLLYSTLRGAVAELWINENMQPCYRVIFLGYNTSTGKYTAYQDSGDKVASTNPVTFSDLALPPAYLPANVKNAYSSSIKREIEIASYKPEDFSSYETNYYLKNMNAVAYSLKGTSSTGTLKSGGFAPLNSVLGGNGSGGSSGATTGGGNTGSDATEEIA